MAYLWLLIMLGAFYALLIRPQRRQLAAHRELLSTLAEGDEVLTAGGIFGTIQQLDDDVCLLEIAPGITIRVARTAISRKVTA